MKRVANHKGEPVTTPLSAIPEGECFRVEKGWTVYMRLAEGARSRLNWGSHNNSDIWSVALKDGKLLHHGGDERVIPLDVRWYVRGEDEPPGGGG